MNSVRKRGEVIRGFILEHVAEHPADIAGMAASKFEISRQAVNKHLQRLVKEGSLEKAGRTKSRTYRLKPTQTWGKDFEISSSLSEDVVFRDDIQGVLGELPDNVRDIWAYGFTEMFNNAIDHSAGAKISVFIGRTAESTRITIQDDGVGIFAKIQESLGLLDESHAVLELAKGKLTTDPDNHTGEGIFFSSRMFDWFSIISGETFFSHTHGEDEDEDWIMENSWHRDGTTVNMELNNHTARTPQQIYAQFSNDDFGFTKTVVPVKLVRYGNENLVSRSQAKRLLARVDRFQTVLFDFSEIDSIGQAFADQIFRVFQGQHPEIKLLEIHANEDVQKMIRRVIEN